MPGLDEVGGHGPTHVAETDEGDRPSHRSNLLANCVIWFDSGDGTPEGSPATFA
jgi:hypothetical protein